jgi:hypothetical protein
MSLPKSRRGESPFPRTFLRGMSPSPPSTSSRAPRAMRNPRGLPRVQQARSLWTRTRRTRRMYSPCSRDTTPMRPRPWIRSQPLARGTGATNTSPGWIEGSYPWTDPRLDASPGWPSRSPLSMASCTSVLRQASCIGAYYPSGARAPSRYTCGDMRSPRGATHPRGQCVTPRLLLAHRGR